MPAMNSPMVRGLAMRLAGIACVAVISLVAYRRCGGITLAVVLLGLAVSLVIRRLNSTAVPSIISEVPQFPKHDP
jgi:hypothetical protein